MTEQFTSAHSDTLEQAIQTIIHDARIPKTLRTALEVYKGNRETGTMRAGQAEPSNCPRCILGSSAAEPYPCTSPSLSYEDSFLLSCESAVIEQGLNIIMTYNRQSLDWSVEINGLRHEGITKEVMEALVECAVIVGEALLMRALCQRPQ
jgi:hypothetical protein